MLMTVHSLLFSCCLLLFVGDAAPILFTFGYLRMGSIDVDSPNSIAGFLATARYANVHNVVPGVRFQVNVTTIPCWNYSDCTNLSDANALLLQNFITSIPGFTAILKPNYIIARRIVSEATRLGGVPVLDADDVRLSSFSEGYEHVINFNHNWQRQAAHLFTYMHQTDRCVHSGIIHGVASEDTPLHVAGIQQLFTDGGFPAPTAMDALSANDTQLLSFVGSKARCFLWIGTPYLLNRVMARLVRLSFDFAAASFYVVSSAAGEDFFVNGSAIPFANTYFIDWSPMFESTVLDQAFQEWIPHLADDAHMFAGGEELPTRVRRYTFQAYMTMMFLIESIRDAVAREDSPNVAGPLPISWNRLVDSFFVGSRRIDGYLFNAPVRSCPAPPAKQICFCNTLTPTSYLFGINITTGTSYTIYDDEIKGQREIASLDVNNNCGYFASSWSYPITGLALYPATLMGTSAHRLSDLEEAYNVFQATFSGMTHEYNYAATAPTRALRYAAYDIKASRSLQDSLDAYIDTLKPFVIFGSMAGTITNSRGILTLGASIIGIETEDPPLVAHSEWRWDIISLQPVLADYIHALVAYYESEVDSFSSLRAIVSTQREAELVSMSFASFGFDVPVSSIAVSDDAVVWSTFVSSWMGPGTETPFIVAASTANNNSVIQAAASTAAQMGRGVLAIACAIVYSEYAKSSAVFANNSNSDIIFGAFRNNWWTAAAYRGVPANLQQYVPSPRYQLAMQILGVAQQLSSQVYYDYKTTAAEVLYQTAVISASGTAFGPFSNATCTDDEIMANTRDRTCQCAKGIRTIYVHSMRNFQDGVASDRTGRFSLTMTACGVIYSPYEPPLGQRLASLSAGAISGIAVGCAVAFLLVVGALVANSLFFGRNNRAAPKDPSQPFAIVFTDIQSSTSLWARAPAAMSEAVDYHHELMRKALRRNDGYEVKTVGDSFMVAFRDPADAARFALDAQVILHTAEWSSELDAIYLELIAEAEAEETAMNEGGDTSSQSKCLGEVIDPKNYLKVSDATSTSHSFSRSDSIQPVSKGLPERNLPSVVITHNRTRQSSIAFTQNIVAGASTVHMTEHDEECNSVKLWHGLRVRVGVHYGMGDIRKDPTTFGYDYYGTVVNTAARVEGVGHGGQILLTDTAFEALPPGFAKSAKAIIVALGPQPLRGLDAPITLFQMVPSALQGRRFPALRLHVEKETEESSVTETNTATGTSGTDTPEALASRICASKQFMGISPDEILDRYYYFLSTFAPIAGKYQSTIIGKLAESWGFDKASKAVHGGEFGRTRLLVSLIAKVTKTYRAGQKAFAKHHRNTTLSQTHDTMSEAVKSIHRAEIASCTDSRNYNY